MWMIAPRALATAQKELVSFVLGPTGQQIVGRRYGRIR
jgi:hypothetical protein